MEILNLATKEKQDEILNKISSVYNYDPIYKKINLVKATYNSNELVSILNMQGRGYLSHVVVGVLGTSNNTEVKLKITIDGTTIFYGMALKASSGSTYLWSTGILNAVSLVAPGTFGAYGLGYNINTTVVDTPLINGSLGSIIISNPIEFNTSLDIEVISKDANATLIGEFLGGVSID